MPTIRTSCRGGSSDVPAGRWQNRSSTAGSAVGSSPRGHSWRIIADSHGHQRLLVQLLNGQMGAASPGPEQHLHALPQQRSPCRGNGAGGRLPPIALTLGGGLPQRRAPVGEQAPAIPVVPAKMSNPHRSQGGHTAKYPTPHLQRRDRLRGAAGPDDEGSCAFAEAVVARSGKILELRLVVAQRRSPRSPRRRRRPDDHRWTVREDQR
jgi:hypothetical protein